MSQLAFALLARALDDEHRLAAAVAARTGRDLSAGLTDRAERAAALRIAIVMNKLQGEFGPEYEAIYGEPIREPVRIHPPKTKGKSHVQT